MERALWEKIPKIGSKSKRLLLKLDFGDFFGGEVVKTSPSSAGGKGSIPGWGSHSPNLVAGKPEHKAAVIL